MYYDQVGLVPGMHSSFKFENYYSNRLKKNIFLVDTEKLFDKIHLPVMIESLGTNLLFVITHGFLALCLFWGGRLWY